jgi:hypothetical protein
MLLPLDGGGWVGVRLDVWLDGAETSPPPQPSPIEGEGALTTLDRP